MSNASRVSNQSAVGPIEPVPGVDETTPKQSLEPTTAQPSATKSDAERVTGSSEGKPPERRPLLELIHLKDSAPSDADLQALVHEAVGLALAKDETANQYQTLIVYDSTPLNRSDADRIYAALNKANAKKPILLILESPGGSASAAYFISKLCMEAAADRFVVAVPRRAKSAATLICCGADELHMGALSELGPIDPQFDDTPALALKYSVEHLAELVKRYPDAAEMFASYLAKTLKPYEIGYYERIAESSMHYADRLLRKRRTQSAVQPMSIAHRLVYEYKDHAFTIDAAETADVFGSGFVKRGTPEYALANRVYGSLSLAKDILLDLHDRFFYFNGLPDDGAAVVRRKRQS